MVDDLFQLSRIESGTLHQSLDEIEVGELVSDMVARMEGVARARGVRLTGGSGDPLVTQADPRELSRALANLARSSTSRGGASVPAHPAPTEAPASGWPSSAASSKPTRAG
jgi:K+-sensing histidine kinase KdpD